MHAQSLNTMYVLRGWIWDHQCGIPHTASEEIEDLCFERPMRMQVQSRSIVALIIIIKRLDIDDLWYSITDGQSLRTTITAKSLRVGIQITKLNVPDNSNH